MRASLAIAWGAPLFGLVVRGPWGAVAAVAAIGIAVSSAPNWARNNFIERRESAWIAKRLERHHRKQQKRAAYEQAKKDRFENPSRLMVFSHKVGCEVALLALLASIIMSIFGIASDSLFKNILGWALALGLIPAAIRLVQLTRLQDLGDEPRGGVKTLTLRDLAIKMNRWPHRLPLFWISSVVAIFAMILLI